MSRPAERAKYVADAAERVRQIVEAKVAEDRRAVLDRLGRSIADDLDRYADDG
jgi:hypothetical protein